MIYLRCLLLRTGVAIWTHDLKKSKILRPILSVKFSAQIDRKFLSSQWGCSKRILCKILIKTFSYTIGSWVGSFILSGIYCYQIVLFRTVIICNLYLRDLCKSLNTHLVTLTITVWQFSTNCATKWPNLILLLQLVMLHLHLHNRVTNFTLEHCYKKFLFYL